MYMAGVVYMQENVQCATACCACVLDSIYHTDRPLFTVNQRLLKRQVKLSLQQLALQRY
jgi:hypothetical protein